MGLRAPMKEDEAWADVEEAAVVGTPSAAVEVLVVPPLVAVSAPPAGVA